MHNWIKPLFREDPNIYKSSRFRVCSLSFLEKRKKNWAKKAIRQGNGDCVYVSNLIHKGWRIFAYAPRFTYHCILLCGWKVNVGMHFVTRLCILFVYTLLIWLLQCCNCLSHVHDFPGNCTYVHILETKMIFLYFWKGFCGYLTWKPSRDLARSLGKSRVLKDLVYILNVTVISTKVS